MPPEKPYAFADVPAVAYPLTIEMWGPGADRAGAPTWQVTADGPGAIDIPALGMGTWVRVTYADGRSNVMPPPNAAPGAKFLPDDALCGACGHPLNGHDARCCWTCDCPDRAFPALSRRFPKPPGL